MNRGQNWRESEGLFLIHLSSSHEVLLCPEGARGWDGWGDEGVLRVGGRPVIQRSSSAEMRKLRRTETRRRTR